MRCYVLDDISILVLGKPITSYGPLPVKSMFELDELDAAFLESR